MREKVVLTPQEFEDLKDDIKFKTTVILEFKQLRGIPRKVDSLSIQSKLHWALFVVIIGGIVRLIWK